MHHNQYEEPLEMATGRGNTECGLISVYFKHQACLISTKKNEGTMQDSGSAWSAITYLASSLSWYGQKKTCPLSLVTIHSSVLCLSYTGFCRDSGDLEYVPGDPGWGTWAQYTCTHAHTQIWDVNQPTPCLRTGKETKVSLKENMCMQDGNLVNKKNK